jgi:hypothetical protein
MGATIRQFQALLNVASEIVANELDKETGKHYSSSSVKQRHRHHNYWGSCYMKQKILALKLRSSLQGEATDHVPSLIELAEEFLDDEVNQVTS